MKLLIATTNSAKFKEYKELFNDLGVKIVCLNDFDFKPVKETGLTFKDNVILKVKGYFSQFRMPVIADDGGLEVDILNGEPGVKSHRWLGYEASSWELVKAVIKKLKGIEKTQRTAKIVTWVAFYDGDNLFLTKKEIKGYIIDKQPSKIQEGFPWRAILFIPPFNKVYQDLTAQENKKINHRVKIVAELKPKIKKVLNNWREKQE